MCEVTDEFYRAGVEYGEAIGEKRGERRGEKRRQIAMNQVILYLLNENRLDDLRRVTSDETYRKQLFRELEITRV